MLGHVFRRLRIVIQGRLLAPVTPPPAPACPNGFLYAVGPGDTLGTLAARFHVTRAALVAANPQAADWGALVPGQLLCIPESEPFEVYLPLRRTVDAPPTAAGVVLARGAPEVGSQVLVAVTGLASAEVRLLREGRAYRSEPVAGGYLDLREPTGMLARFESLEVWSDGKVALEALGRDCLPRPAESPLAPF